MSSKSNNIIGGSVLGLIGLIILWTVLFNRDSTGFQTVRNAGIGTWILTLIFWAASAYTIYWGLKKKSTPNPGWLTFATFAFAAIGTLILWLS